MLRRRRFLPLDMISHASPTLLNLFFLSAILRLNAPRAMWGRAYYEANKEAILARHKVWKQKNKEAHRAQQVEYRRKNRDAIAAQGREHYEQNRALIAAHQREYYYKNKGLKAARQRVYKKARRAKDPEFRLLEALRIRLRRALFAQGIEKDKRTLDFLGAGIGVVKLHLAETFQPGMGWENYGMWHVDHIRPCASFNLLDPEQVKACFHYTNLQALWAADNLKKGDKYDN